MTCHCGHKGGNLFQHRITSYTEFILTTITLHEGEVCEWELIAEVCCIMIAQYS